MRARSAMRQVHELQTARAYCPPCCAKQQIQGVHLHAHITSKTMHKFKFCTKCQESKPPEGGINIGFKWHCQRCWINRTTNRHLKQYATPKTT
jgi:hypothetical protein